MTKLERAMQAAEQLPQEMQERLADNLLQYVDRYVALKKDVAIGVAQLDAGDTVDGEVVFARMRAKLGA